MDTDELPRIDEHDVLIAAPPERVWTAAVAVFGRLFASTPTRQLARLLGCDPPGAAGWGRPGPGATIPGFRVLTAEAPHLLVVAGRHRFSRYGIVLRIEPAAGGARCRLESRAEFPGAGGRLYRLAVVGSGGHVVAVRGLLDAIRRAAQDPDGGSPAGRVVTPR